MSINQSVERFPRPRRLTCGDVSGFSTARATKAPRSLCDSLPYLRNPWAFRVNLYLCRASPASSVFVSELLYIAAIRGCSKKQALLKG